MDLQKSLLPNLAQLLQRNGHRSQKSGRDTKGKERAQEVYAMFVENLDTLEKATQKVEILRRCYDNFDT